MTIRLLFLPLILVSSFFSLVFLGKPLWKENKLLKEDVEKLTINLTEIKGKNNSVQKVISEYQKLGDEKALIKNALPEDKEGNILLAEFFEKAKKSGVFLSSVNIGQEESVSLDFLGEPEVEGEEKMDKKDIIASVFESKQEIENSYGLKKAENNLELIGSYEEARNFILEVEKMNRFLNIVSVEFKKNKDASVSGETQTKEEAAIAKKEVIDVSLKADTYWLKSREKEVADKFKNGVDEVKNFSMKDLVIKSILGGKFSFEVISDFQNSITKEIFYFGSENGQVGGGKNNLF